MSVLPHPTPFVLATWQRVWREAVAPQLSTAALLALERGLRTDDPALVQGCTTSPPPLQCVEDWPCEGACLMCYGPWRAEELGTVREVEEVFARLCFEADQRLGEPAGIRWLLSEYDQWLRAEMIRNLLPEVQHVLAYRQGVPAGSAA